MAFVGGYTVFTGAPSALNTALALRQAIWRKTDPTWAMCGIPDILNVDHGSDFTSHHLKRTAIELHIRLIHSIVGRPQGRGKIERSESSSLPTTPEFTANSASRRMTPGFLKAGCLGCLTVSRNSTDFC